MLRFIYLTASLAAAIGLWPTFVSADDSIIPEISYTYYEVSKEEGRSLSNSLFGATPIFHEGRTYAGLTDSYFSYNYETEEPTIGVCRIQQIDVNVRCVITLPKLVNGDAQLNEVFGKYLKSLKDHELEHCRITTYYAARFKKYLDGQDDVKCAVLREKIKKEHVKLVSELEGEQRRYDHRTVHGKYEGADLNQHLKEAERGNPPLTAPIPGSGKGLINIDSGADLSGSGIYKDKNGVWRNY